MISYIRDLIHIHTDWACRGIKFERNSKYKDYFTPHLLKLILKYLSVVICFSLFLDIY